MRKYIWWVGIGAYVVVVFFVAALVTKETECAYNYLPCLEPNGLGDFLAGIFAPLAFLWLARAVFMQSSQLEMQKEELTLTREEMKLARQVAEDTQKEIKAQAEAMRLQKDILQSQLDDERRVRADKEVEALLGNLFELLKIFPNFLVVTWTKPGIDVNSWTQDDDILYWYLFGYYKIDGSVMSPSLFSQVYSKLNKSAGHDDADLSSFKIVFNEEKLILLRSLIRNLEVILSISEAAGDATREYIRASRLHVMWSDLIEAEKILLEIVALYGSQR